jgi:hypothetical protein
MPVLLVAPVRAASRGARTIAPLPTWRTLPAHHATPDTDCYCVYSSGSTGLFVCLLFVVVLMWLMVVL